MEQIKNNEDIINNVRFQHDKIQILKITTAEMWCEIFDRINDPKDKESFINSSLFFRELVRSKRTQFLFQSVFGVLGKKYEQNLTFPGSVYRESERPNVGRNDDNSVETNSDDEDDAEAVHIAGLVKSLAQRLRSVCKSWDGAVAHFYGNHYLHYRQQNYAPKWNSVERVTERIIEDVFSPIKPGHEDKFLEHFVTTHEDSGNRSPFFGKSVYFHFPLEQNETAAASREKILSILTKYGHHLWQCTIRIAQFPFRIVESYSKLCALLELLPNLKVLRVHADRTCRFHNTAVIKPRVLKQLKTEISLWPLPALKDLQLLNIQGVTTPIFQELIRSYPHVSTLDITDLRDEGDSDVYAVPLQLPMLTTLYVSFRTEADFNNFMKSLMPCPLNKLWVNFGKIEFMDWQLIFTKLEEKWADSLTELEITLPVAERTEQKRKLYLESQALQMNFPRLKCLKISLNNFCCLDFLLSLKNSLVHLEIANTAIGDIKEVLSDTDNLETRRLIKLPKFFDCSLDGNIMLLFPKLSRVLLKQYAECGCPCNRRYYHSWSQSREEWREESSNEDMKN